jgi:hypothetical protein
MKKSMGIIVCCLLSGCSPLFFLEDPTRSIKYKDKPLSTPSKDDLSPYQDTAPLPWVSVLPSERAIQMKEVDFHNIALQLRHDMRFPPFNHKFNNVQMVLLDYGIEEVPTAGLENSAVKEKGISYLSHYAKKVQKYVMKASFYTFDNRPPNPPCFEEKIYFDVSKAGPSEAIKLMAHEIILDHLASPLKKITVDLD